MNSEFMNSLDEIMIILVIAINFTDNGKEFVTAYPIVGTIVTIYWALALFFFALEYINKVKNKVIR
jgi:hypothetical protein